MRWSSVALAGVVMGMFGEAGAVLAFYADYFDRSEGAMEKAARILHEIAHEEPV